MESSDRHVFELGEVRADGWFEELGAGIPEFDQLCQVVGARFVAFSFVSGVRIASIAYDPHAPHASLVDFYIGDDDEVQRTTLSELRERLGQVILSAPDDSAPLPERPDADAVRRFIGRRYLLLAPIFGVTLEALEYGGGQEPLLRLGFGSTGESITVQGLRDVLHSAIRSELARSRPNQPFSIDFKRVPQAEAANERGEFDETIALLGAWPGPLSMFLRTPQGQALGEPERTKLVRALGALGDAYLGKGQGEWAEDVLRLGIQFGQELPAASLLFGLLGRSRVETERYGEAIGLLRRALSLGGDGRTLLPLLARCFVERARHVAAMACVEQALQAGADDAELWEIRQRAEQALGPAYDRLRLFLGSGA